MGSAKQIRKVAFDMTWMLGSWAIWFVPIVIIIYFVATFMQGGEALSNNQLNELVMRILDRQGNEIHTQLDGFVAFMIHPSKIFMLVIGISTVSALLTFYVKHGVTRRDYFYGKIIAIIAIAFVIALVSSLISLIEGIFISPGMGLQDVYVGGLLLVIHVLNMLIYFTGGWLIGVGFYRYGGGGLLFIALAIALAVAFEAVWTMELGLAILGTIVLIAASCFVVRLITKRVRIKLK